MTDGRAAGALGVPVRGALRAGLSRALEGLGLFRAAWVARHALAVASPAALYRNARYRLRGDPDPLPLPSLRSRILVAGSADVRWFLDSGARAAASIEGTLRSHGIDMRGLASVLDFGCGCGRVLRHWKGLEGVQIHGADACPALVEEARRTVPFAEVRRNLPHPPLPYADASHDLVYALSVFTHLDAHQHLAWRDEVRRVLRPGGLFLLSTHGGAYLPGLTGGERRRFLAGDLVVRRAAYGGGNLCVAFHPERYVRETLAHGYALVDYIPRGAAGNPYQDLVLLARGA